MCVILNSHILSLVVWFIFYNCIIFLFVVSKPSLWTIDQKTQLYHPVTSVVLIHIRLYHVSVEVRKRLIYYLSGRVQVHVCVCICTIYCIVCNLLCEQKKTKKKRIMPSRTCPILPFLRTLSSLSLCRGNIVPCNCPKGLRSLRWPGLSLQDQAIPFLVWLFLAFRASPWLHQRGGHKAWDCPK